MMRTAFTACRLASVIFIIPFMFVYNNALLLIGPPAQIFLVCITSFLGVLSIAFAAQNYLAGKLPFLVRMALFVSGGCLIFPGWKTDAIGLGLLALVLAIRLPKTLRHYTIGWLRKEKAA
jgi:TRAP-type uncharacterized transport system fused permease subunit